MSKQQLATSLKIASGQLMALRVQTLQATGKDAHPELLLLLNRQKDLIETIRLLLILYAEGDCLLSAHVQQRLFEFDLEVMLEECAISKEPA